jgi:hypothetical protein
LFTHSGAGEALRVGVAFWVDIVALGGEAVAVAPRLIAVGLTDIAGTAGDVYSPTVEESPEPPATVLAVVLGPRFTATATPMAAIPATAANGLMRTALMPRLSFAIDLHFPSYARIARMVGAHNGIYESAKRIASNHNDNWLRNN